MSKLFVCHILPVYASATILSRNKCFAWCQKQDCALQRIVGEKESSENAREKNWLCGYAIRYMYTRQANLYFECVDFMENGLCERGKKRARFSLEIELAWIEPDINTAMRNRSLCMLCFVLDRKDKFTVSPFCVALWLYMFPVRWVFFDRIVYRKSIL